MTSRRLSDETAVPANDELDGTVLDVLLTLRLLGFASIDAIVAHPCGPVSAESAAIGLRSAANLGWVAERRGRPVGWSLSAAGRAAGERLLMAELDHGERRVELEHWYGVFRPLNGRLLAVCTRWQLRRREDGAEVVNDHLDRAYDAKVLDDLEVLHAESAELLGGLAATADRFGTYRGRLDHALGRVRGGDYDWVTRPIIDSYHTVWFELHEHLLATLGSSRHQERTGKSFVAPERAE